jgi:hypothetical protein
MSDKIKMEVTREEALLICTALSELRAANKSEQLVESVETGHVMRSQPAPDPRGDKSLKSVLNYIVSSIKMADVKAKSGQSQRGKLVASLLKSIFRAECSYRVLAAKAARMDVSSKRALKAMSGAISKVTSNLKKLESMD